MHAITYLLQHSFSEKALKDKSCKDRTKTHRED